MKFLIWFGLLLVATIINAFIGVLIGFRAGWLIIYLVVSFFANRLCKKWNEHQASKTQESGYQQEKEMYQQQHMLQKEKEARKAKMEALAKDTKDAVVRNANIEAFLEGAANCATCKEILTLWDSLDPVDNETNAAIRKEIDDKVAIEKMYGTNPRGIPTFLANLEQTYGTAVIETIPTPEVVEEEAEEKPLTDMDVQFAAFLENAAQCGSYAKILELWDSQNWSESYTAVRKDIEAKYSTEKMYGVIPRGIPKFLETLRQTYGAG